LTVGKGTQKNHRSLYKHRVLVRLAELLSPGVKVCVVRRPRFGDQKLYRVLTDELYFDHVIRFHGNIAATATTGETRTAAGLVHRTDAHAYCAAPRSPPNAIQWEP
jgi:hypothetical protein